MLRWLRAKWIYWATPTITVSLHYLTTLPGRLVENAALGWLDDLIIGAFGTGITKIMWIETFVWEWDIPLALTAPIIFYINKRLISQPLAKSLYVGQMEVSLDKMETDYCIEITLTGINNFRSAVRIGEITGHAKYVLTNCPFPLPTISFSTSQREIRPSAEFVIVLEQRLPGAIVGNVTTTLADCKRIQIDFSSLNISISAAGRSNEIVRLPIWDGVMIGRI